MLEWEQCENSAGSAVLARVCVVRVGVVVLGFSFFIALIFT